MLLDILTQTTPAKSTDQNQCEVVNFYLEEEQTTKLAQYPYSYTNDNPKGEYKFVLYPTFGLSTFCDTGQANVRAMFEQNEILYVVAGSKFYSINSAGTKTELGTLNTSTGFAKIRAITGGSDTNNQLIIIDGTKGYLYNIGTSTATFPITDVDFPQTCTDIAAQDDYFAVEVNGSISFQLSNLSSGGTWDALDFASKFRKPDRLMGIISNKGELWLIGSRTTEVWQNTGNASFPFTRRSDVFLEEGCAATQSIVVAAESLCFLIQSKAGGYAFCLIDSYVAKNITTKPIMYQLSQLTTVSDCIGYAYAKDGHEFIDWTFPTDNKTFTFDISNQSWTIRQSYISSSYGRFLGSCSAACYGKSLIGDYNSGKIYTQESNIYTENGVPIRRRFTSVPVYQGGKLIYIHRLQIDVQTNVGSNKTFTLEISRDRGNTWESPETFTVPTSGDGTIYTTSLGSARCFLFRITTTGDFNFTLLGFQAEVSIGAH